MSPHVGTRYELTCDVCEVMTAMTALVGTTMTVRGRRRAEASVAQCREPADGIMPYQGSRHGRAAKSQPKQTRRIEWGRGGGGAKMALASGLFDTRDRDRPALLPFTPLSTPHLGL